MKVYLSIVTQDAQNLNTYTSEDFTHADDLMFRLKEAHRCCDTLFEIQPHLKAAWVQIDDGNGNDDHVVTHRRERP